MVNSANPGGEIYVLESKPIQKGSITEIYLYPSERGSSNKDTKPVGDLEAVLVASNYPRDMEMFRGEYGQPIYTIGVRQIGSSEPLTIWRTGFVEHKDHQHIFTSPYASKSITLDDLKALLETIKSADDVVEIKNMINEFHNTIC